MARRDLNFDPCAPGSERDGGRDGEVLSGSSYVDEAMISGEPVPVAKGEGDEVVGGTINKTGSFTYRATKVGADTLRPKSSACGGGAIGLETAIQAEVRTRRDGLVFSPIVHRRGDPHLPRLAGSSDRAGARPSGLVICGGVADHLPGPCRRWGLATPTSIMVGTGRGRGNGRAVPQWRGVADLALAGRRGGFRQDRYA